MITGSPGTPPDLSDIDQFNYLNVPTLCRLSLLRPGESKLTELIKEKLTGTAVVLSQTRVSDVLDKFSLAGEKSLLIAQDPHIDDYLNKAGSFMSDVRIHWCGAEAIDILKSVLRSCSSLKALHFSFEIFDGVWGEIQKVFEEFKVAFSKLTGVGFYITGNTITTWPAAWSEFNFIALETFTLIAPITNLALMTVLNPIATSKLKLLHLQIPEMGSNTIMLQNTSALLLNKAKQVTRFISQKSDEHVDAVHYSTDTAYIDFKQKEVAPLNSLDGLSALWIEGDISADLQKIKETNDLTALNLTNFELNATTTDFVLEHAQKLSSLMIVNILPSAVTMYSTVLGIVQNAKELKVISIPWDNSFRTGNSQLDALFDLNSNLDLCFWIKRSDESVLIQTIAANKKYWYKLELLQNDQGDRVDQNWLKAARLNAKTSPTGIEQNIQDKKDVEVDYFADDYEDDKGDKVDCNCATNAEHQQNKEHVPEQESQDSFNGVLMYKVSLKSNVAYINTNKDSNKQ